MGYTYREGGGDPRVWIASVRWDRRRVATAVCVLHDCARRARRAGSRSARRARDYAICELLRQRSAERTASLRSV
eukprot:8771267-Lingulodinium_polyedra.AAC.1